MEAIALRLEAIASKLEAIATRVEAIASRVELGEERLQSFSYPSDSYRSVFLYPNADLSGCIWLIMVDPPQLYLGCCLEIFES